MLAAFLLVEKRAGEPLLALSLFRHRVIALMSANFFLMGISLFGVAVYLPLFLQGVLGGSAAESGVIFAQYTLSLLAGGVIGGQLLSMLIANQCLSKEQAGELLKKIADTITTSLDQPTTDLQAVAKKPLREHAEALRKLAADLSPSLDFHGGRFP